MGVLYCSLAPIFLILTVYYKNSMAKKLTTETFIQRAREVHGDKYDYSKVNYINSYTKVEIICPIHGSFWQTPGHHLYGEGCKHCHRKNFYTTEIFIQKAK
jgi:hypothetical protein